MNSVQKLFLKTVLILITLVILIGRAQAQTDPCPPMPAGYICVPRAVGVKALEDADARAALEKQVKAQDDAIVGYKDELEKMRIEFARVSGELTATKQTQVRDAAIIEMLLQNVKKKRNALITIF